MLDRGNLSGERNVGKRDREGLGWGGADLVLGSMITESCPCKAPRAQSVGALGAIPTFTYSTQLCRPAVFPGLVSFSPPILWTPRQQRQRCVVYLRSPNVLE